MAGIDTRAVAAEGLPEEPFPPVTHEFRVHVAEDAFDRITARGASEPSREVGGILVGRVCRDAGGAFVRVDATIDALHAEEKGTELTFTHATWDHIHREMEARHAGLKIVGWYHTHPGFGVFLSDRDQFIQRSFFNLPFQVALVFDPHSREHGLFAWRENEPLRVRRWWVGPREHLWDGTHPPPGGAAPAAAREERAMTEKARPAEAPSRDDLLPPGVVAVVALLAGGVAGWWIGQRGMSDVAAQYRTQLDEVRLEGARDAVRGLNRDLLHTLRRAVDQDTRSAELQSAIGEMDAVLASLPRDDAAAKDRAAALERARSRLRALQESGGRVSLHLKALEDQVLSATPDALETARRVQEQGRVLGQLCAALGESAARAGDAQQALIFLTLAARCDPGNADVYGKRIDALGGGPPK